VAPPSTRRPGFSRRAQYSLFASYVVAVAGILLALLLALTARFDPGSHAAIQGAVADAALPVTRAGRAVVAGATSSIAGVAAYIDAGSKNRLLEAQVRADRTRLIQARALERENHRLRRLVRLVGTRPPPIVAAHLVASTGASSRRYATLSAGSAQGVANGQPVRTSEGLVGRVVAAGRSTARVLLITDAGNVVPVRRLTDGMPALATGRGDGALDIRPLQSGSNPFKPGDIFMTSGAGGIYPPDAPVAIGKVTTRDKIVGRPLADPTRLDFAIVEPPFVPPAPSATGLPLP